MRTMSNTVMTCAVLSAVLSLMLADRAAAVEALLDFDALGDGEAVQEYYNGGQSGSGIGPGANYGVSFSENVEDHRRHRRRRYHPRLWLRSHHQYGRRLQLRIFI